ncbi:MAG: aminoglycoside 3-N-acetyltransferase [Candidatus Latescibacteria bacterium]|nr:aminoglycoside 3-N-acetyltransferase [Candidatus Latescibacterota bacterium]
MSGTGDSIVTRSKLVEAFRRLGVEPGDTLMLHASVRAVGWVVGGPDVVLAALLEVLGERGTLMMMVGWEEQVYDFPEWPAQRQAAYLGECPAFDPASSRANRRWSILTEYLRTWPGAMRSDHPEKSMAAVGRQAAWLTADHPLHYGFGPGSPLAKLCAAGGRVLLLGAPLNSLTILHHAEDRAAVPRKRVVRYQMPVLVRGERRWVEIEEFDTCQGIVDWEGPDYFELIAQEYMADSGMRPGWVGGAISYLFPAAPLVDFAARWMERAFGPQPGGP